jgi:hypothetical protein
MITIITEKSSLQFGESKKLKKYYRTTVVSPIIACINVPETNQMKVMSGKIKNLVNNPKSKPETQINQLVKNYSLTREALIRQVIKSLKKYVHAPKRLFPVFCYKKKSKGVESFEELKKNKNILDDSGNLIAEILTPGGSLASIADIRSMFKIYSVVLEKVEPNKTVLAGSLTPGHRPVDIFDKNFQD